MAYQYMAYLRKSFYCVICSGQTHSNIGTAGGSPQIALSENFCQKTFSLLGLYFQYKILIVYPAIININRGLNCLENENTKFKFDFWGLKF